MTQIQAPCFSSIHVMESRYSPRTQAASLFIELRGEDRKLAPKGINTRDFSLIIDRKGELKGQYYWPGAGNTIKLDLRQIVPLIRKMTGEDVWLATHDGTTRHFKNALRRFQQAIEGIED